MTGPNPQQPPPVGREEEYYAPPPPGPPPSTGLHSNHPPPQTDNASGAYELPAQHFPPPPPGPPPSQQHPPGMPSALQEAGILSQSGHAAPAGQKFPQVSQPYNPSETPLSPELGEQEVPPVKPPRPDIPPHHTNDVPIPEYDPSHPHFAPPPSDAAAYNLAAGDEAHQGRHHRGWLADMGAKAAGPINALANKLGSQSFLPTTLDKECEKAARILKSFCKEGITSDATLQPPATSDAAAGAAADRPVTPTKDKEKKERGAIVKIPSKVIAKAKGLAIFTTARVGFQFSGATGSGILIARLPDGSWSPPSGIQVHAVGAGFMIGVDIYDCVCVINSRDALAAFMSTRVSLGPDVAVVAGPYGAGGVLDFGAAPGSSSKKPEEGKPATTEPAQATGAIPPPAATPAEEGKLKPEEKKHKRSSSSSALKPVFSYVKSRGFYAGIQIDGTVVTERKEANADFYGKKVSVEQILRGEVPAPGTSSHWPTGAKPLYDALKIAETPKPGESTLVTPATGPLPTTAAGAGAPGQPQARDVPGAVSVPLHRHEEQRPLQGGNPPPFTGSAAQEEHPPPYVDDGIPKPGAGDNKTSYQ